MKNLINRDLSTKDFKLRCEKAREAYYATLLAWGGFGVTFWIVLEFFWNIG